MKLSIRLFQSYDVVVKAGLSKLLTLQYNNEKNRRVELIASNTKIAKFVDHRNNTFTDKLSPQTLVANDTLK